MKAAVAIGGVDGWGVDGSSRDVIFFTAVAPECDLLHSRYKLSRNFSSYTGLIRTYSALDVI